MGERETGARPEADPAWCAYHHQIETGTKAVAYRCFECWHLFEGDELRSIIDADFCPVCVHDF